MPSSRAADEKPPRFDHLHEGFHFAGTVDVDARHGGYVSSIHSCRV
jgi:hypothetical protein